MALFLGQGEAMKLVLFLLILFIFLPIAFKFPNIIKSLFIGVFNFAIYFIKHLPEILNSKNQKK
ncbi:hypothetical protein CHI95_15010 [Providencia rettgeri]|uniref:Uncharacterized protein n=1 Tax=Providencia rettgeri TaxID=587 RepID=A0A264VR82_PRORE|nr:hypothetical protein CHI95_15010 [Providencia rettgeri]